MKALLGVFYSANLLGAPVSPEDQTEGKMLNSCRLLLAFVEVTPRSNLMSFHLFQNLSPLPVVFLPTQNGEGSDPFPPQFRYPVEVHGFGFLSH